MTVAPAAGRYGGCSLEAFVPMIHETCGRLSLRTSSAKASTRVPCGTGAMPRWYSGEVVGAVWNCLNHASGLSSPVSGS